MIKPIQLLHESLETYKKNFKNIFWMSLPILLATYGISFASSQASVLVDAKIFNSSLALYIVIFFVLLLVLSLLLAPALNRAIQKKEDHHVFNSKEAYSFQKKHIWKWIMLNIWGLLYMAWRMLPYLVVASLPVIYLHISQDIITETFGLVLSALMGFILVFGILMNLTRFILFKTIFFSKEIAPRKAVQESFALGIEKNRDLWCMILSMVLFGLAVAVLSIIVAIPVSMFGTSSEVMDSYISPIITLMLTTPVLLIITAKGYVKIRD